MHANLTDGPGSINTDWEGLKRIAAEFCRAAKDANEDELENGYKCFGLAWLSCNEFPGGLLGRVAKEAEHPALMRIVTTEYMKRRFPILY